MDNERKIALNVSFIVHYVMHNGVNRGFKHKDKINLNQGGFFYVYFLSSCYIYCRLI